MTKQKGKARRATLRKRASGSPARVKQVTAPAPGDALTFAVPGVGVVDIHGQAVAPVVTRSQSMPTCPFEPKPVQAPHHPEDCPGCVTPELVRAKGWPKPCRCWTAAEPVDGQVESQTWYGGMPLSVQEREGEPPTFHRFFCSFWDHYPAASAPF